MTEPDTEATFDDPARWRADVIQEMRLRDVERCAAASPAPGFPQLLEMILSSFDEAPAGPWIDVGGGLGGVADWLMRRSRRRVVMFEPSSTSAVAAGELFPLVRVVQATGECLPLADSSVSAIVVSGVVSLMEDPEPFVCELGRVLCDGGVLAVADLWSATSQSEPAPPNHFWAVEHLMDLALEHGLEFAGVGMCQPGTGSWPDAAVQVNDVIGRRFRDRDGFDAWDEDQRHLTRVIASGLVLPGGCSFRKLPAVAAENCGMDPVTSG